MHKSSGDKDMVNPPWTWSAKARIKDTKMVPEKLQNIEMFQNKNQNTVLRYISIKKLEFCQLIIL